jgi:hypothetical protein
MTLIMKKAEVFDPDIANKSLNPEEPDYCS